MASTFNSGSANQSPGCPVPVGNSICGEANSLDIMKEFNKLYQERMQQVDSEAGGDCLQEKIKLQQEWIRNLTQQNEMLVRAVQELEYEATERVQQLEEKLHKSAQCLCEVMKKYREHDFTVDLLAEPLQKISHLEDDLKNVLEFIRRIRENEEWSIDGLFFHNITKQDLLGTKCKYSNKLTKDDSSEGEKLLQEKDTTVQELTQKLNYYTSFGDVEGMVKDLKSRQEELESLKQEMTDMRQALTEEVALKHDQIIMLRRDVRILEDRCLQADKQTAFKEDIIRELRKEIKQLKQQVTDKYLSLVAAQLQMFFDNHKSVSDEKNNISKNFSNTIEGQKESLINNETEQLKKYITVRDHLLEEQLDLIKVLVTRLFTLDKSLKNLEERALSVTTCVADREMDALKERIQSLENENVSLKETLTTEKIHIVELDEQFKGFLEDRDSLKRKNKDLEKKVKFVTKEKETINCECMTLKSEIRRLKEENDRLQAGVKKDKEELEICKTELVVCQTKMKEVVDENNKSLDQILSLNKENRILSDTIDELRQKTIFTCNVTQGEFTKLNSIIGDLQNKLEKTQLVQEEEEKIHQEEISQLSKNVNILENSFKALEDKYERDAKTCKICRGKSKVGFVESVQVQANLERKESELEKTLHDSRSRMTIEIEKRNNKIQVLKNKVEELEAALNTCEERATNLQEAVTLYSSSVNVLETAKEDALEQIQHQKITIANLQQALVDAKQEVDEMRRKTQENVSGGGSWSAWFGLSSSSDVTNNNNPSKTVELNNKSVHDI